MRSNNFQPDNFIEQEEFSLAEVFFRYLRHWKFFVISIVICLGLAYIYLRYTTPEYRVSSRIIINDERRGETLDMSSAFNDIGLFRPKNNLDNEIEVLRSWSLAKSVGDSLRLNVSYFRSGNIKKIEIYRRTPVFVSIPNVMASGSFTIDKVEENGLSIKSEKPAFNQTVEIGKEINSPWGILKLTLNPFGTDSYPIEVSVRPSYFAAVDINSVNKTSSVVELSLVTPTPEKGKDIINTLIAHYNKNAIEDKNYVAHSTISFIDERLLAVSGELQTAEKNVESYQKSQGITNLESQGQLLLTSSSEFDKKIVDANIQLDLLRSTKSYLMNPSNNDNTIPTGIGINDQTVISLINKYNEQILSKKRATGGMSENHPLRIDYDNQVALIRDDLLRGIGISEAGMLSTIRELQRQNNMYIGKARDLTTQGRESRDLLRQSVLKESLFTYLLQKREDTELSLVMATPNAKVIDPASFSGIPVVPKKMIILFAALILGIIIPIIFIYVRDLFDNKIHTKEDVTKSISAPFLGIIPVTKGEDPFPVLKVRSSMTERFRTILSNLDFVLGNEKRKIVSITSFTSGDGKSFFSRNLAMTLATTGKKTLLVDLDLRKSVLVKTLGLSSTEKGSAMFLSDPKITINEVIDASHKFHKNLDIIPVKVFPPNPAELLSSERLEQLFQAIGGLNYDYIIIDTAPVGLVADIYNINDYTLATIFLLRSEFTLKKNLTEIQELYNEKKLNNLCVVLNAVTDENIYGYGYGYGRYGYYKHNYYTDDK